MRSTAHSSLLARLYLGASLVFVSSGVVAPNLYCQAVAPAARASGTVKSIDAGQIVLTTAAGAQVTITVPATASILQLSPGSTDLKTATQAAIGDISVGDRVLATARGGDASATPTAMTAARLVLMKSSDIAARQSAQQAEWQRNGIGGLVRAVDGSVLTMSAGARTVKVETTPATIFRRYADDSVKFADAKPGKLDDVHAGDQISVRGAKSEDGLSIRAAEVVTGTFENLSGPITAVDAAAGTISIRDLVTKKTLVVNVTANSDLRALPAQAAAAFAARSAGSGSAAANAPAGAPAGRAVQRSGPPAASSTSGADQAPHSAGMDLSRMLSRLPAQTLTDLKPGAAVMIVAALDRAGGESLTAITLLSGVEPLLTATSSGSQPITLSPWNLGAPEGAGGGPQ